MTAHAQPTERPALRVLDLGAHDGYVGAWIRSQHPGPVELYGIELHPQGVFEARRRGYERVEQGDALDAAALLPDMVGTFDAVVAFEILEHVPDMHEFLEVCERMLNPHGQVYVSTPDGCFGDGGNPHHLRALRAQDLVDLLRRRGELTNVAVGSDTITTASYKPAARVGEAVIYTGPCWGRWHPMDIDRTGLGGSETAAVHLARELAAIGWVVTVYGDVDAAPGQPGATAYGQVLYKHYTTFDPLEPVDLLISSRYPEVFDRPARAGRRMLWLHDIDAGDRLTPRIAERLDDVLVLSGWQLGHVAGRYPFLRGGRDRSTKLRQIRNGIDLARFTGEQVDRENRVLFTSSPDRGLDVLLELWPRIRKACRGRVDAPTLEACYSPVYWQIAEQDPTVGAHAARIRELADQPGVTLLPSQGQADLARLMMASAVWVAPSFNTPSGQPFHETSCIGAMEAQAAGLHVVASNWGALPETVKVGALIDGPPMSDTWKAGIVQEVVRGLIDPETRTHAEQAGPEHARSLGWAPVAQRVTNLTLESLMTGSVARRAAVAAAAAG